MSKLDEQLAALTTMSSAQLSVEWRRVLKAPAPSLGDDLLRRGIAYRLQERAFGALPADARRHIEQLARTLGQDKPAAPVARTKVGTRLVREWQGRVHQVLVLDEGYLFEERRYASLTRIANEITGANWSGPRFFGLVRRTKATGATVRG